MGLVSVLVAAAGAYAFGAIWYMLLSRQWMAAAGVACDDAGKPLNKSAMPFVLSAIAMIVVAGMMRHMFGMAGIDTISEGLVAGFGLGAFIAFPWVATNYAYAGRPPALTLIDGTYAVAGCTIIGMILPLF
jgi:hypothetical protein